MNITNSPIKSLCTNQANIRNKSDIKPQIQEQNYYQNTVNFTGLSNYIKPMFNRSIKFDNQTRYFLEEVSSIINVDIDKVVNAAKGKTKKQIKFLNALTKHYNSYNFYRPEAEKENGEIVLELFNRIKNPKEEHFSFVNKLDISVNSIKKCFDKCEDNPEKLKKVEKVRFLLSNTQDGKNLLNQIIESPNMKEYVENIDKYIPHFEAHNETKGLIETLDKQMGTKAFDITTKHKEKQLDRIINYYPKNSGLTKEVLTKNYSKEGIALIIDIKTKLSPTQKSMQEGDLNGILRIYNSTTPENGKFRKEFIENNYYNFSKRENFEKEEINNLSALFEYADKNPVIKKFLNNIDFKRYNCNNTSDILKLINSVSAEKLAHNQKIVKKIFSNNKTNQIEAVIEHFGKRSPFDKFVDSIKNIFVKKPESVIQKKTYVEPSVEIAPTKPVSILPEEMVQKQEKVQQHTISFKPVVPKQPNAKKLIVINDVNNVIEKKLGAKTLSEQSRIYADKATKMRLSMLPEIFESIKDTRAAERAKGTFSKSKSVSNSDAVDLYTRINGKNKKLVNYMLKKRNADGTRMFNVRDIIDTLADANREVLKGKAGSTKLNRFSAKDERAIYESFFEQKVAEHGKLQKTKTSKK